MSILKRFEDASVQMAVAIVISNISAEIALAHSGMGVAMIRPYGLLRAFIDKTSEETINVYGEEEIAGDENLEKFTAVIEYHTHEFESVVKELEDELIESARFSLKREDELSMFQNILAVYKGISGWREFFTSEESVDDFAERLGTSEMLITVIMMKFQEEVKNVIKEQDMTLSEHGNISNIFH